MSNIQPTNTNTVPEPGAIGNATTRQAPPYAWFAWLAFVVLIIAVAGAAMYQQMRKARLGPPLPVMGVVPPFTLVNQEGTTVTQELLAGNPYVIDFIFTRCGGQCPLMTQRMRALQGWLNEKDVDEVKLVSVTVDPENDSAEIMKAYGTNHKADMNRWMFLTGGRPEIYGLITEGFKLGVEENQGKPVSDMFVHSSKSVLVDGKKQIRGYFVLEEDDEMERMRAAIRRLRFEAREAPATPATNPS